MELTTEKGGVCTDPSYWPGHPEWENSVRSFAKHNLELLKECKKIRYVTGYFGWEDLPEKERIEYENRFAMIKEKHNIGAV